MDLPPLPPVPPGRTALPAFLALEAWVAKERGGARARAEADLEAARAEARRIEGDGAARLENVVLQAEREAARTAEDAARDRVSAARVALHRWVDAAEAGLPPLVEEAVRRLTGG